MNFPTTTEEFLKTLAHGKEPTREDREYAEALGKLSELNYRAGYEAGKTATKTDVIPQNSMFYKLHRKI